MKLSEADISRIIEMAWEDRTPFDAIEAQFNLSHDEICQASTTKLRKILKEDIPVEVDDMINYELYIREFS